MTMATVNAREMAEMVAGLDKYERGILLSALADEIPNDKAARWLRSVADVIHPYDQKFDCWRWMKNIEGQYPSGYQSYELRSLIVEDLLYKIQGTVKETSWASVKYHTETDAWEHLFSLLLNPTWSFQ